MLQKKSIEKTWYACESNIYCKIFSIPMIKKNHFYSLCGAEAQKCYGLSAFRMCSSCSLTAFWTSVIMWMLSVLEQKHEVNGQKSEYTTSNSERLTSLTSIAFLHHAWGIRYKAFDRLPSIFFRSPLWPLINPSRPWKRWTDTLEITCIHHFVRDSYSPAPGLTIPFKRRSVTIRSIRVSTPLHLTYKRIPMMAKSTYNSSRPRKISSLFLWMNKLLKIINVLVLLYFF